MGMSEQELAEIRAYIREGAERWVGDEVEPVVGIVNSLLAEVERLRADYVELYELKDDTSREAMRLQDENAALREIAQAVADGRLFSESPGEAMLLPEVSARWVDKARALLGDTEKASE